MAGNIENEAMQRLKQMYSNARQNDNTPIHNRQTSNRAENKPATTEKETQKEVSALEKRNDNLLDVFMRDKEKSLILLLIVLLISEKADTTLILALMYLIL